MVYVDRAICFVRFSVCEVHKKEMGWKNKKAASSSLKRILDWDFERIIISHGDLIEENARAVALFVT